MGMCHRFEGATTRRWHRSPLKGCKSRRYKVIWMEVARKKDMEKVKIRLRWSETGE